MRSVNLELRCALQLLSALPAVTMKPSERAALKIAARNRKRGGQLVPRML